MNDAKSPFLEMKKISKIYGNGTYANRMVDFSVEKGEIHALVGENGAGKSTLMKILFGLEKATDGEIILNGRKLSLSSPQDAIAVGIGMVHQHFKLVESFSILENVTMGYEPVRRGFINRREANERVEKISRLFGLKDPLDTPVRSLPVGTKQKVEIIKALYRDAEILILDEPTSVLTPQETEELFTRLKNLKAEGYTVIFISHKLREVKQISDRVSVMRQGNMVDTCITSDVTEQEISEKMVGKNYSSDLHKKEARFGGAALEVKELTKTGPGGKLLVDHVSFTVRAGQILGIAGVEGNGQNELIAMLTGLTRISSGEVRLLGQPTKGKSVARLRGEGMSYIPSDRMILGLAGSMTVADNLIATKLGQKGLCRGGFLSRRQISAASRELIARYTIKCGSEDTEVSMLSGGNAQKVVVAREFTTGAKVIIVEQPTRGIDVGAAKFIHEELLRLRDMGCAILLVSADLEELYSLSNQILVMYDGHFSAYIKDPAKISEKDLGCYMLGVSRQDSSEIEEAYYEKTESAG